MGQLPIKSYARKIVKAGTREDQIRGVAYVDNVDLVEAERRVNVAMAQRANRSAAQVIRHLHEAEKLAEAKRRVLLIAHHEGKFLCHKDLSLIAIIAGWDSLDTGRPFREVCMPLEKSGFIQELRDSDDKFIGYTITKTGRDELFAEV